MQLSRLLANIPKSSNVWKPHIIASRYWCIRVGTEEPDTIDFDDVNNSTENEESSVMENDVNEIHEENSHQLQGVV